MYAFCFTIKFPRRLYIHASPRVYQPTFPNYNQNFFPNRIFHPPFFSLPLFILFLQFFAWILSITETYYCIRMKIFLRIIFASPKLCSIATPFFFFFFFYPAFLVISLSNSSDSFVPGKSVEHARPIFLRFWPLSKRITRSRGERRRRIEMREMLEWSTRLERRGGWIGMDIPPMERFYRSGRGIYSRDGCSPGQIHQQLDLLGRWINLSIHGRRSTDGVVSIRREDEESISIEPYRQIILSFFSFFFRNFLRISLKTRNNFSLYNNVDLLNC